MDKTIPFERVKKIALENTERIRERICRPHQAAMVAVKHYLATGEALRTKKYGCPNVAAKLAETLEGFIRGLDVRCVGELLELIPEGLDKRLPGWLYEQPVEARLGEDGWELVPAA